MAGKSVNASMEIITRNGAESFLGLVVSGRWPVAGGEGHGARGENGEVGYWSLITGHQPPATSHCY